MGRKLSDSEKEALEMATPFQRELIEAMVQLGYEHDFFLVYVRRLNHGVSRINVNDLVDIQGAILTFYREGSDQKGYEIMKAIGIPI